MSGVVTNYIHLQDTFSAWLVRTGFVSRFLDASNSRFHCQDVGVRESGLGLSDGPRGDPSFSSEVCFASCRRAGGWDGARAARYGLQSEFRPGSAPHCRFGPRACALLADRRLGGGEQR